MLRALILSFYNLRRAEAELAESLARAEKSEAETHGARADVLAQFAQQEELKQQLRAAESTVVELQHKV